MIGSTSELFFPAKLFLRATLSQHRQLSLGDAELYSSVFILLLATAVSGQITSGQSTPVPARPTHATRTQSSGQHLKAASTASGYYQQISAGEHLRWFAQSTVGPESLTAGLFSAGFGTAIDRPREYGPHWDGLGKRYAMRLTGVSTGNAIEAGLGCCVGRRSTIFPRRRPAYQKAAEKCDGDGFSRLATAMETWGRHMPGISATRATTSSRTPGGRTVNPARAMPTYAFCSVLRERWAAMRLQSSGPTPAS